MEINFIREYKRKMTLLLCLALLAQGATAFAAEKGSAGAGVSGNVIESVSAGMAAAESLSGNSAEGAGTDAPERVSGDANEGLSTDVPESVSEDAAEGIGTDVPVSVSEDISCGGTEEKPEDSVFLKKDIRAVLYDCTEYAMRAKPDEGSAVTGSIPCATTVVLRSVSFNGSKCWLYCTALLGETTCEGYIEREKLVCIDEDFIAWESGLYAENTGERSGEAFISSVINEQAVNSIDDFPESYRDRLYALAAKYPNWVFVPQNISSLTLEAAVNGEYADKNRNWIGSSAKDSYKDGATGQSGWYYASKECISYYMNPVNFMDETRIFMFEQLAYNSSYHTMDGVQSILNGTFMSGNIEDDTQTYAEAFMKIGKALGLSPYHLSSRVRLEQGVKGTSALISGTYPGYENLYNYFNIKASGSTDEEVIVNGLTYARQQGWNTRYKSLNGGASFLGNNYIGQGQDTLYLEKFDLVGTLYTHQYMQNVQAPYTESATTYNQYKNAGTLSNPFVFKIPVFKDSGSSGEDTPESSDKTVNEKLAVSFKLVSKANLFYSESVSESFAIYRVNSNEVINSITVSPKTVNAAGTDPYFEVAEYKDGLLKLKTKNRTAANTRNIYKKFIASVSSDSGSVEVTLNVSTINKKPVIKAAAAVVYEGFSSGAVMLTDNNGNVPEFPEDIKLTTADTGIDCALNRETGCITVSPNESFKAGTKKFTLISEEWTSALTVQAAVKKGGKPVLKVESSSVTLNTNIPMEKYGTRDIGVRVNGSGLKISSLTISANNEKTRAALDNGLFVSYDGNGKVRCGLDQAAPAKGNYTVLLNGEVLNTDGSTYRMKPVKFTVKVTDKSLERSYMLRAAGRINTVDRADSCIRLTPLLSDTGAKKVTGVQIDDTEHFEVSLLKKGEVTYDGVYVTLDTGLIVIKAKEGVSLLRGNPYKAEITSELDNGLLIKKTVTIRPVQSPAKVYGNIVTAAMTRYSSASRNYIIRSKGVTINDTVIEKVEPDFGKYAGYFSYTPALGAGSSRSYPGLFVISDKSIANGTYSLRFKVYLKGKAENTNPAVVTLKVRIR